MLRQVADACKSFEMILSRVAVCTGDLYYLGHSHTPSVTTQFQYLHREFRQITENQTLSLAACFDLLDQLGDQGLVVAPVMERQRLLNQVIINVLLHNPDAHLKNYAMMLQNNGVICVTPLYDCLCTYGLNFSANGEVSRNMSLRIGGAIAIDTISQQDWSQFAIECGFTAAFVRRRVRELAKKLGDVLPHTVESVIAQYPLAERAANAVRDGVSQQINMVLNEDPVAGPIT